MARATGVLSANLTEKFHVARGNVDVRDALRLAHSEPFGELPLAASRKFVRASGGGASTDHFP
jgi:hypothetical protein